MGAVGKLWGKMETQSFDSTRLGRKETGLTTGLIGLTRVHVIRVTDERCGFGSGIPLPADVGCCVDERGRACTWCRVMRIQLFQERARPRLRPSGT